MSIDFSNLSVDDCPLCKQLIDNLDAIHCTVCHKALCVEHIRFTLNPMTERAERYFCPEHIPPTPPVPEIRNLSKAEIEEMRRVDPQGYSP